MNGPLRTLTTLALLGASLLAAGCTPQPVTKTGPTPTVTPTQPKPIVRPVIESAEAKAAAARFESLINVADAKVAAAKDMRCRLVRTEMVGNVLQPVEELDFRQRFSPHSLRLKWVGERFKDRDLIFVSGANDNKVLVKEKGGLSGWITGGRPLRLALDSPMVTGVSRYAPDVAGYNNLVKRIAKLYRDARPLRLAWVEASPVESASVRRTQKFEVTLEPILLENDVSRMVVWFDLSTSLPIHTVLYDAKGRMVEDYDWQNLRLDAGLTDADFRFETGP